MSNKLLIFIKYYIPAIIWAGLIFYFSSIPGPGIRYFSENAHEIVLRKTAHFLEFGILAILLWRIFYKAQKLSFKKAYWFTLGGVILYAISDEIHQSFVFGRSGKVADVLVDSLSAIFSLELFLIIFKKRINWKNFLVLILSMLITSGLVLSMIIEAKRFKNSDAQIIIDKDNEEEISNNYFEPEEISKEKEELFSETEIPKKLLIPVPFTSQAPFAVWDEIHKEACEEASIIMLRYFLTGEKLTPQIAEKEIQALVEFQNNNYGDYKDTNARETADLFLDFYGEIGDGKKLKVVYDFKKEDLKKYLARGYPIIVPAAGRKLGNPNFTGLGPLYHNLVLVGFNGDTTITNDPGTRKGEKYKYNLDVLYEAIHDFPGRPEDIENGRKAMIVIE